MWINSKFLNPIIYLHLIFPITNTLINHKILFLKKYYSLLKKGNVDFVSICFFTFVLFHSQRLYDQS